MMSGKISSVSILLIMLMLVISIVNANPIEKRDGPGGRLAARDNDAMAARQLLTTTTLTIDGTPWTVTFKPTTATLLPSGTEFLPITDGGDFGPLHDPSSSWTFPVYPTSIDFGNGATTPPPGWTGPVLPPPPPTDWTPLPISTPCTTGGGKGKKRGEHSPKTTQAP